MNRSSQSHPVFKSHVSVTAYLHSSLLLCPSDNHFKIAPAKGVLRCFKNAVDLGFSFNSKVTTNFMITGFSAASTRPTGRV